MIRFIRSNELYHYGRSINDGAPGVGTGNWRRGLFGGAIFRATLKTFPEDQIKKLRSFSNDMGDQSYTIKRSDKQSFQRIGDKNEKDIGRTYVSYLETDNIKYIDMSGEGGISGRYKIQFNQLEDINVAKGKPARDAFIDILEKHSVDEVVDFIRPEQYKSRYEEQRRKQIKDMLSSIDTPMRLLKAYKEFSKGLMRDNDISKEYFNNLALKGYNAVVDENDRGWVDEPLIILDRMQSLRTKKVSEITTKERDAAIELVNKWANEEVDLYDTDEEDFW